MRYYDGDEDAFAKPITDDASAQAKAAIKAILAQLGADKPRTHKACVCEYAADCCRECQGTYDDIRECEVYEQHRIGFKQPEIGQGCKNNNGKVVR
jgi:hypothetical protein